MTARAKKKITTTTEEVEDERAEGESEELDGDVVRALVELEGSNEVRWKIYRQSGTDPGFCAERSTAELSLQSIADDFGPGRYQIVGVKADGAYFRSKRVSIAKSSRKPETSNDLIAALKSGAPDQNILLAMMQSNTTIVAAALSKPDKPEKEFPWKEIIAASPLVLTAMKDFFAKKDESNEAMDRLLKQLTLVEKLRGDDKKEGSSWPDIIRDALPALSSMVTRPGAPHSARAGVVPQPPAAVLAAAVLGHEGNVTAEANGLETPEAIVPSPEVMAMDFLKRKFEELLQNAAENKDPELRAALLLDDLPSYISDEWILSMLRHTEWFERMVTFDARIANYRGWFTDLREYLLHSLQNADDLPPRNDEQTPESVQS